MENQGHSPQVNKLVDVPHLTFPQAIEEITNGKMVNKIEWDNKNIYGVLQDGFLMIHLSDGKFSRWTLSDGDLIGTDYIVL